MSKLISVVRVFRISIFRRKGKGPSFLNQTPLLRTKVSLKLLPEKNKLAFLGKNAFGIGVAYISRDFLAHQESQAEKKTKAARIWCHSCRKTCKNPMKATPCDQF